MITRRHILKSMTTVPLAAAIPIKTFFSQTPPSAASGLQLNVLLHGLHLLVVRSDDSGTPDHLEVLTPHVDMHAYKAGNWKNEENILMSAKLELSGVRSSTDPIDIDYNYHIILSAGVLPFFLIDPAGKAHMNLRLPIPKNILALRRVSTKRPFSGHHASLIHTNGFPLVTALVYDLDNKAAVKLAGVNWTPEFKKPPSTPNLEVANLHLWGEPDNTVTEQHNRDASHALLELLPGLQMNFVPLPPPPPDEHPGVPGVERMHTLGLYDRLHDDGLVKTPANCHCMIVFPCTTTY
jgi:hypothetical protein